VNRIASKGFYPRIDKKQYQVAEKLLKCHCEERFLRHGNLEVLDVMKHEIASLRSQRRLKKLIQ
jgi:hypothetical protein